MTITGYRSLTQDETDLINEIKDAESAIARLVVQVQHNAYGTEAGAQGEALRQAAIARTEFEHAFMRLVRSVAQPVSPWS